MAKIFITVIIQLVFATFFLIIGMTIGRDIMIVLAFSCVISIQLDDKINKALAK